MHRRFPIKIWSATSLVGMLLLVSCDGDGGGEAPAGDSQKREHSRYVHEQKPVTTGTPMYESAYEMWTEEVESLEKRKSANEDVPKRLVSQCVSGVERNLQAAKVSLKAETRQILEMKHALLRQDNAKFEEERVLKAQDMQQLKRILSDVAKGIRPLPEGRTRAELQDMLAERQREFEVVEKDQKALHARMAAIYNRLEEPDPEPLEKSKLRTLVDDFQSLLERAKKLQ
ncbi:MAG: hypothetical protein V3T86_12075 [Planctomycetota bacterium]